MAKNDKLYSVREATAELGLPPEKKQRVLNLVKRLGVGQKVGWVWMLTQSDINTLRNNL